MNWYCFYSFLLFSVIDSSSAYPTHDTRYQNYSQDYRQSGYGPSTDSYATVSQDSYSSGQYDDRSYGNYGEFF
jgi:hypothetical protein